MNIFADENIAHSLVVRLRADGHHVECMADVAMGSPDTDVLSIANQQNAVVLTEDKDFGELVRFRQMPAVGVILIRLNGFAPGERAEIVAKVIRSYENELPGSFTVIKPHVVRIRPNRHRSESAE